MRSGYSRIGGDYGSARCGVAVSNPDRPLQRGLPREAHLLSGWLDAQRVRADRRGE